jgi:RNA polymerase sigma factor (sigma-70 family)
VILALLQNDAQKLRSFDHRATEKTWLRVVVKHQVVRYFKQQKPTESLEYLPEMALPLQLPDQEEKTLSRERRELLAKMQGQLTGREQELLGCLREGLSDEEIAACMRVQVRSIQRTKCRLFQKLRSSLCSGALKGTLNH